MKRHTTVIVVVAALVLAQLACNFPTGATSGGSTTATPLDLTTATSTLPAIITATPNPGAGANPTNTPAPTATQSSNSGNNGGNTGNDGGTTGGDTACSYKVTFIGDVSIPDDTVVNAGSSFVKTWRVRNDGSCTWGPTGYALHALAFTGGSQMGAPGVIALHTNVKPGQTVDLSVTLDAPSAPGTYTSNWMLRVDNDPSGRGPYIGLGPNKDQPLYARIKVGSALTRLNFNAGATQIVVNGTLQANQSKGYLLAAQKSQILMAMLSPNAIDNGAKLKVTTGNNASLPGGSNADGSSATVTLPSTQDYIVWVTGGSQKTDFTFNVIIPSRITFDPGATSDSVDGRVSSHMTVSYVLRALAGQTMTVDLTGSNIGLTIYGLQDGQPLVRAESGATSWTGSLPGTQDYIINVVPAVDSTTFTLDVTVK